MYFDDTGQLAKTKVYIVWGSPASGKTTYVKTHMKEGDIVVDLDAIKQAISLKARQDIPENLLNVALEIRDLLYEKIHSSEFICENAWVIACLPREEQRDRLKAKMNGTLIHCDATKEECLMRSKLDPERTDKMLDREIIEKYWDRFEPDPPYKKP